MKQLAWVQFFSWFAASFYLPVPVYNTFTAQQTPSEAYNTGANQVGEMFAIII
jgi:maltose/moltooligosaccharide transporter